MMEGKGTKLRDIPNVAFKMSKISGRDELMESLHNILYRRKGAATTRKKAILDFNGFAFAAENEEKEIEARKVSLGKWKLDLINKLLDTLDIPRGSGDKGTKIDLVVEFLEKPEQRSEVDLAAKEAAKKEKEKRKRERAAAQKAKKDKAKKRKAASSEKAGSSKKKAKKEEESGSEDSEAEDESDEQSGSESEEEVLPTKQVKSAAKTPAPKATKEKKATPKSAAAKKAPTPAKKSAAEEEEQPVMKLSLDKIKTDVESLLSKMNDDELGMLTVKTLLAKMQEHYGFEVRPRKSDFKAVMHAYAEVRLPQAPADEPAAAEAAAAAAEPTPVAEEEVA
jgi:protein DEK